MIVLEFKAYGKPNQYDAVDEAIRTVQFIRNKAIRYWMDNRGSGQNDLQKYCAVLAKEFPFANELNSMARQAAAERAWSAISRFYENCRQQIVGKKGFPKFQKDCRSVEYKTSGWKLADDRKSITFTDKKNIGRLKLKGTRDLHFYQADQIKRVRLVKRADGYYAQFCIRVDRTEEVQCSRALEIGSNHHSKLDPQKIRSRPRQFARAGFSPIGNNHRRIEHPHRHTR